MIRWLPVALLLPWSAQAQPHLISIPVSVVIASDAMENPSASVTITSSDGNAISVAPATVSGPFILQPEQGEIIQTPVNYKITCSCLNQPAGTLSGSLTIPVAGGTAFTVPLSAVVTPPAPPAITSMVNGASFADASSGISPGEILTIFGSGLGGPSPQTGIKGNTGVGTQAGSTAAIFFDGGLKEYYAPILYASAQQINLMVPYEIAGWSQGFLQIGSAGGWFLPKKPNVAYAPSAPGIFTAGSGQAAALNSDNSPNSPSNPAPTGSVIQVFMTGEGQTSPAGVSGSVTCSTGCSSLSQIPKPVLPVTATVNGQSAAIQFSGEAPGLVAGVLQVNLVIPPSTKSGAASLVISVGGVQSQAGVTISVK